jgi:hypothetical protein
MIDDVNFAPKWISGRSNKIKVPPPPGVSEVAGARGGKCPRRQVPEAAGARGA